MPLVLVLHCEVLLADMQNTTVSAEQHALILLFYPFAHRVKRREVMWGAVVLVQPLYSAGFCAAVVVWMVGSTISSIISDCMFARLSSDNLVCAPWNLILP